MSEEFDEEEMMGDYVQTNPPGLGKVMHVPGWPLHADAPLAELARARELLRELRDGDHIYGNDSERMLIKIDALLARAGGKP